MRACSQRAPPHPSARLHSSTTAPSSLLSPRPRSRTRVAAAPTVARRRRRPCRAGPRLGCARCSTARTTASPRSRGATASCYRRAATPSTSHLGVWRLKPRRRRRWTHCTAQLPGSFQTASRQIPGICLLRFQAASRQITGRLQASTRHLPCTSATPPFRSVRQLHLVACTSATTPCHTPHPTPVHTPHPAPHTPAPPPGGALTNNTNSAAVSEPGAGSLSGGARALLDGLDMDALGRMSLAEAVATMARVRGGQQSPSLCSAARDSRVCAPRVRL
jgi:hypothetical protein